MKKLSDSIGFTLLLLVAVATAAAAGKNKNKEIHRLQKKLGIETISDRPPDFQLISFAGDSISLQKYRGKFLIIHFWATWCKPCRKEMPELIAFSRALSRKDVQILAFSIDKTEKKDQAKQMVEEWRLPFPAAMVTSGQISDVYWTWGIPVTYFIDARGKMIGRILGSAKWKDPLMKVFIQKILTKE